MAQIGLVACRVLGLWIMYDTLTVTCRVRVHRGVHTIPRRYITRLCRSDTLRTAKACHCQRTTMRGVSYRFPDQSDCYRRAGTCPVCEYTRDEPCMCWICAQPTMHPRSSRMRRALSCRARELARLTDKAHPGGGSRRSVARPSFRARGHAVVHFRPSRGPREPRAHARSMRIRLSVSL
ncbi:hypothetical protein GY45DRAFT_1332643 [Cubamyces sp. BRFM 1775]|nr:hypothetical protein GY45DRAFT_1332643 [Cubamyces sp. BRFM 1775]